MLELKYWLRCRISLALPHNITIPHKLLIPHSATIIIFRAKRKWWKKWKAKEIESCHVSLIYYVIGRFFRNHTRPNNLLKTHRLSEQNICSSVKFIQFTHFNKSKLFECISNWMNFNAHKRIKTTLRIKLDCLFIIVIWMVYIRRIFKCFSLCSIHKQKHNLAVKFQCKGNECKYPWEHESEFMTHVCDIMNFVSLSWCEWNFLNLSHHHLQQDQKKEKQKRIFLWQRTNFKLFLSHGRKIFFQVKKSSGSGVSYISRSLSLFYRLFKINIIFFFR